MPGYVNASGTWKEAAPYIKVGGTWKFSPEAWENVSGEWKNWFLSAGVNDSSFATYDVYNAANGSVNSIKIQSDGKIVLGGLFLTFNEVTVNRIVRLNTDGTQDTTFTTNTGTGVDGSINSIAIQSDGKIILGGAFTTFNGVTVNRIVRLNTNGTRDTTFTTNTGTGAPSSVSAIAIQSDGKIVLGGLFLTFNGVTVNRIVRLNTDGTQDTAFTTNTGTGASSTVRAIAIQSDGKIVLGGDFTTFNTVTVNRIVRLNSDGTRDTTFTTNTGTAASTSIDAIAIQSDGKIVLGGTFSTFNGVTVNLIVRLNSDGTRDTIFTTNTGIGASNSVSAIAIQSDGKIILGGAFTTFNGVTVNRIVRLNTNGTQDTAGFPTNTGAGLSVVAVAIQSDGKIILGGGFTTFNGVTVNRIVRLNTDGTQDTAFTTNTGTGATSTVNSIAIQSDGKIILGGAFPAFNGVTVNRIVRLNTNGTRDTTFTTNTGTGTNGTVNSIKIQSDGKIVLGGDFTTFNTVTVNRIVRLNSDGTRDTAFTTNTGTGPAPNSVNAIAIQSDGKIILGGAFTTFNGVTVNRIVRLNTNGTRDTTFTTNTGTGAPNSVSAIAIQSDGKIVLGGLFLTFNEVTVNRIVRLNTDGTQDTTFTTNTGIGASNSVSAIAIQSDGKIILGGGFTTFNEVTVNRIVRLNTDGTQDTAFTTNTGTGVDSTVNSIAIQSDGKIILGGGFQGFNEVTRTHLARLGGDLTS
jgi:uncharacterized delta-60 repeat protein